MKDHKREHSLIISVISAAVFFIILAVFGQSQAVEMKHSDKREGLIMERFQV